MTLKSDAKFEEKATLAPKMTWGIWRIFTQPLKTPKFRWAIFVQSIIGLS